MAPIITNRIEKQIRNLVFLLSIMRTSSFASLLKETFQAIGYEVRETPRGGTVGVSKDNYRLDPYDLGQDLR
jgi:hypothetical protein